MSVASLVALATGIAGLLTALGTFLAQLGHIAWHKNNPMPEQPEIEPAAVPGTKP